MKREASDTRNTTTSAMSSGVPMRAAGVLAVMCGTLQSKPVSRTSVSPVWIIPGATAFTRMSGPYSSAAVAVSAATAAFAAA